MIRVGFSGLPGVGKTSIARGVVSKLAPDCNVELINEYARRYITKYGFPEELWEQIRITENQLDWENSVAPETEVVVTDSPVFLGLVFALTFERKSIKDDMLLGDLFKKLINMNRQNQYDLIIHISENREVKDDGIRPALHLDPKWRKNTEHLIISTIQTFQPKRWIILKEEDYDKRVLESILHIDKELRKKKNVIPKK